jgi:hypothetical protein
MDGAIYVLTRQVQGDRGERLMQNVTVFASSAAEARQLVAQEFEALRKASRSAERPYQALPPFNVEKIRLNEHKLITSGITA